MLKHHLRMNLQTHTHSKTLLSQWLSMKSVCVCVYVPRVCSAAVVRSAGVQSASGVRVRESLWLQMATGRHKAHTSAADAHTPETHRRTCQRHIVCLRVSVCVSLYLLQVSSHHCCLIQCVSEWWELKNTECVRLNHPSEHTHHLHAHTCTHTHTHSQLLKN